MKFIIEKNVKVTFPELDLLVVEIHDIKVKKVSNIFTSADFDVFNEVKLLDSFFDRVEFASFRELYKKLNIDLVKYPPAVEFLFKRFLKNNKIPNINNVVDCVNKVAVTSLVPLGAFDFNAIRGDMRLRFTQEGEEFHALGGDLILLPANALVIADDEKILNLFPYRDSCFERVTEKTTDIFVLADVVGGIDKDRVEKAIDEATGLIVKHAEGKVGVKIRTEIGESSNIRFSSFSQKPDTSVKQRVFSGTRATGRLHLGNYLGALKGYIELQNNPAYDCIYMAMDLHTITTPYNSKTLANQTQNIIIDYLAAGLNPEKAIITKQSLVPEHSELAFLFSSVMSIARMQHLPTFKDKVKQHPDNVTMALLNYPIFMAADILVYKASLVPVGIDQEPHLEVTREISRKMNEQYGMDFPQPQRFATRGEYIPSLIGEGKMSKSVENSFINLTDSLDMIANKIAKIPTDSGQGNKLPQSGGVANLLIFIELFEGLERKRELEKQYLGDGIRYGEVKKELAQAIYQELKPIQEKRLELEINQSYINNIIKNGATRAREIASQTIKEVKEKMGFINL